MGYNENMEKLYAKRKRQIMENLELGPVCEMCGEASASLSGSTYLCAHCAEKESIIVDGELRDLNTARYGRR